MFNGRADAKEEPMIIQMQLVLPVETKEWQQPSMTTMKNLIVPSSIAI